MRGLAPLLIALAACSAQRPYFVDYETFGWRCDGGRTFQAIDGGDGPAAARIVIGSASYSLPFESQRTEGTVTVVRYQDGAITYENREDIGKPLTSAEHYAASLTGVPEGAFENCRLDPSVAH